MHANTLITLAIHLSRYNNDNDVIYGDEWTLLLLGTKEMGGNHNNIRCFSLSYREENLWMVGVCMYKIILECICLLQRISNEKG